LEHNEQGINIANLWYRNLTARRSLISGKRFETIMVPGSKCLEADYFVLAPTLWNIYVNYGRGQIAVDQFHAKYLHIRFGPN
jgi:hypothetical protein